MRSLSSRFPCAALLAVTLLTYHFSLLTLPATSPPPPGLLTYQGRVSVGTLAFHGEGYFKFALVDPTGTVTYWSNDGTTSGEPVNATTSSVFEGSATVLLGDISLPQMTTIPASVFLENSDVRLRVWFKDSAGPTGFEQLSPDQRIVSVGYAFLAANVPDGAITGAKIANRALGSSSFAPNTLTGANFAAGTLTSDQLAPNAMRDNLAASGTTPVSSGGQSVVPSGGIIFSQDPASASLASAGYVRIGIGNEMPDGWTSSLANYTPTARSGHTATWTGSEMLVWGGYDASGYLASGGRYDPATNRWAALGLLNTPSARYAHTAVWSGTDLLIWGGYGEAGASQTGARYHPASDTWALLSPNGAPAARYHHTAVWQDTPIGTGRMVIFGGYGASGILGGGSAYAFQRGVGNALSEPGWTTLSATGAPAARALHTAVLVPDATAPQLIVWGGVGASGYLADGARLDLVAGTWTALPAPNAPTKRQLHTAVWTGTQMLVFGGRADTGLLGTGARYDLVSNSWSALPSSGAPSPRAGHTAVWAASSGQMLLFGGYGNAGLSVDAGRYDPVANSWSPLAATGTPEPRSGHTAIWTGSEMIVWGGDGAVGVLATGGRYLAATPAWTPLPIETSPAPRGGHAAVWTGTEFIVFGGYTDLGFSADGARYLPTTNVWTPLPATGAPSARALHSAVWSGTQILVWGGVGPAGYLATGARLTPGALSWTALPTPATNVLDPRQGHTAVWSGTEMIIWGGRGTPGYRGTGARYLPGNPGTWTALAAGNAPTAREGHTAVSTGAEMIIWGGVANGGLQDSGARYRYANDTWTTMSASPLARRQTHAAAFALATGEMLVFGGYGVSGPMSDGARYDPGANTWALLPAGGPSPRGSHSAVWSGTDFIVWGGYGPNGVLGDGSRLSLATNTWAALPLGLAPAPRQDHTAIWTSGGMLIWGGYGSAGYLGDPVVRYRLPAQLYLYARP